MLVPILSLLPIAAVLAQYLSYGHNTSHEVPHPQEACARLAQSFREPNVQINVVQYISAGTNLTLEQGYNVSKCDRPSQIVPVDLCRVAMNVATSNRSEITLEAWLPSNWTGRFLSTGNGGLSGCIQYEDIAYAVWYGFATVGANNGHNGTSGLAFLNNSDVVADFSYRSVHTGVVIGKQLTKHYYGSAHKKSYYLGCSTGGRQGFKEIQDFPGDFDGVVAGAPALAFNNLSSWSGSFLAKTGTPKSPTFLTPALWALVHKDILAQCDALDGVTDGIIEDNGLCAYRPENILCPSNSRANATTCLTGTQVQTVRSIFTDLNGADGQIVYSRMNYGSELTDSDFYYSGLPFSYTEDWYRYAIYNDPSWSASTLNVADYTAAHAKNPSNIETWEGDLSAFQARGGKVIQYHGTADDVITSENSARYYNFVSQTMGLPSNELDDFYRFFRIPGMAHCSGGVGASVIGQNSQLLEGGVAQTAQNNLLLRIVDWVENGGAPETVTGYKYVSDLTSLGVDFERNHCRYPLRNMCVDPANYKKPEAWKCV